jgi:hypothetical protein
VCPVADRRGRWTGSCPARLAGDNVGEDHAGALAGHHSLGGEAHHDLARRGRAVDQLLEGARPSSNTTTIMTKTYDLVRFNLHVTVHLVNTGVYVSSNLPVGKDTTAPYQIRPRVFHNEALPTARITFSHLQFKHHYRKIPFF